MCALASIFTLMNKIFVRFYDIDWMHMENEYNFWTMSHKIFVTHVYNNNANIRYNIAITLYLIYVYFTYYNVSRYIEL